VLSTRGHNTIHVNGADQNRRADRATWVLPEPFQPLDNLRATRDTFDFVAGQHASGYGTKRAIQVTHARAVVTSKGSGTLRMVTVLYPLVPTAACPIRSVTLLPVTASVRVAGPQTVLDK
jgi:hypothetical protein